MRRLWNCIPKSRSRWYGGEMEFLDSVVREVAVALVFEIYVITNRHSKQYVMCGESQPDTWDQLISSETSCYIASDKKGRCCNSKRRDEVSGDQVDNEGRAEKNWREFELYDDTGLEVSHDAGASCSCGC
jgi:hypothetical protein